MFKESMQGVIFNLDGTLLDTSQLIYERVCYIFKKSGVNPPSFPKMWSDYTPPLCNYLKSNGIEMEHKMILALFNQHPEIYSAKLFSDALPVLQKYKTAGVKVGVVSSNVYATVMMHCSKGGVTPLADDIIGDTFNTSRAIQALCKKWQVHPANVSYVGDMGFDMQEASKAGAVAVGITRTYGTKEILKKHGAQICVDNLHELFTCLSFSDTPCQSGYLLTVKSYRKSKGNMRDGRNNKTGKNVTVEQVNEKGERLKFIFAGKYNTFSELQKKLERDCQKEIDKNGGGKFHIPKNIPINNHGKTFLPL